MNWENEKVWIVGSIIVGFVSAIICYFIDTFSFIEIFSIAIGFSLMFWFFSIVKRVVSVKIEEMGKRDERFYHDDDYKIFGFIRKDSWLYKWQKRNQIGIFLGLIIAIIILFIINYIWR
jgi:hypothetical protein